MVRIGRRGLLGGIGALAFATGVGSATGRRAPPTITRHWQLDAGSDEGRQGFAYTVEPVDGGYLVGGLFQTAGEGFVSKVGPAGERLWTTTLSVGDHYVKVESIVPTDAGAVVTGSGPRMLWLAHVTSDGVDWTRTFEAGDNDGATAVVPTGDGYVGVGDAFDSDTASDVWLVGTDGDGQRRWERTVDNPQASESSIDSPTTAVRGTGGGVVVGGYTSQFDPEEGFLMETNADGNVRWFETYRTDRGGGEDWCRITDVARMPGGGYVFVGRSTADNDTEQSMGWVGRVDDGGRLRWSRVFGESGRENHFYAVDTTSAGGLVVAGRQVRGDTVAWLLRLDGEGEELWRRERTDRGGRFEGVAATGEHAAVAVGYDERLGPIAAKYAPNRPPTVQLSVSPEAPRATQPVTLDASASSDPDTTIESVSWDLDGDGEAEATGFSVEHSFEAAGEHEVAVTATDPAGASTTETVTLAVEPNRPPTGSIAVEPAEPTAGESVTLSAVEVEDAETSVASYEWDVDGDGSTDGTGAEFETSFDAAGERRVVLTLADTAGATAEVETTVTVRAPPTTAPTEPEGGDDGGGGDASGNDGGSDGGSSSPVPGFGVGATLAGILGGLELRRRRD